MDIFSNHLYGFLLFLNVVIQIACYPLLLDTSPLLQPLSPPHKHEKSPLSVIYSNPRYGPNGEYLWEKDMLLTEDQKNGFSNDFASRTARKDLKSRWPDGRIPYVLNPEMISSKTIIQQGMKLWSDFSCITFHELKTSPNFPHIIIKETGTGCNSWVGIFNETSRGQPVSLDQQCHDIPAITHEMGHVIGLWHEQDRLDRNQYLHIYYENMEKGDEIFFKTANLDIITYGIPYDYGSIMQYDVYPFSKNGKKTLVPKDPLAEAIMGRTTKPSFKDYKKVNAMYNCSDGCKSSSLQCKNGGFRTWNTKRQCFCICPEGFIGDTCHIPIPIPPKCSAKFTHPPKSLTTPNYPNTLPPDEKCVWWFQAPPGQKVQVKFTHVDLLPRYPKTLECVWDKVQIELNNIFIDDPGITRCGKELENQIFTSKRENLIIILTTNKDTYATGFKLHVKFINEQQMSDFANNTEATNASNTTLTNGNSF